jgi:hypothetical protein
MNARAARYRRQTGSDGRRSARIIGCGAAALYQDCQVRGRRDANDRFGTQDAGHIRYAGAACGMQAKQTLRMGLATLAEFVAMKVRRFGQTRKQHGNEQHWQ